MKIKNEFNPHSEQQKVYREMKTLEFDNLTEDPKSMSNATLKLNSHILNNAYLLPKHHQNESRKTKFLQGTILRYSLAREVLIQTSNIEIPYQKCKPGYKVL